MGSVRNYTLAGLAAGLALGAGAFATQSETPNVVARQTNAGRLTALETRVAEQDDAIADLEDRVSNLERGGMPTGGTGDTIEAPAGAVDLTFEGTGDTITEGFVVGPGPLRFEAVHQGGGNFAVWIYGGGDSRDLVYNEIGPYQGQRVSQIGDASGFSIGARADSVFLEVTADGPWQIRVTQ